MTTWDNSDERKTPTSSREWDSSAYDRISAPQLSWGKKVVERLSVRGDETVLDAG